MPLKCIYCHKTADYLVHGYSLCKEHVKKFREDESKAQKEYIKNSQEIKRRKEKREILEPAKPNKDLENYEAKPKWWK